MMMIGWSYVQINKLEELRESREAEEVAEERAWNDLKVAQAVSERGRERATVTFDFPNKQHLCQTLFEFI